MYGSSFTCVTRRPRASRSAPTDALASPLPIDETTPPVTNTNLVGLRLILGAPPSIAPGRPSSSWRSPSPTDANSTRAAHPRESADDRKPCYVDGPLSAAPLCGHSCRMPQQGLG